MNEYRDIINLPHHVSQKRRPMGRRERAAQFSPFAALTGYDAVIAESGRLTGERIELSEDSRAVLDAKQQLLLEHLAERPEIVITYFLPDEFKEGGAYVCIKGRVKKLDCIERLIIMIDGKKIPMDEVISMEGEFFDKM
ncbi:MAG: hypothetical protein IJB78_01650 [Oscillospiraceae bacterium]|nr:hypothetical protein [Oscillospiraceae bacterium]